MPDIPNVRVPPMAKKKAPKRQTAKKPQPAKEQAPIAIAIRGTPQWKAWAEGFATWAKCPSLNDLAGEAIREKAERMEYPVEPPIRVQPRFGRKTG
jgi:hypothetical protein